MFHVLSKLLYFLSTPITWIFLCLLIGLLIKNRSRGKKLIWTSLILLYFFSNQLIFNQINGLWEPPMTDLNSIEKKFKIGVVLGGSSVMAPKANQINFSESADRYITGLELYQRGKIKKVMFCGGHGNVFSNTDPEGKYSADLAVRLKLPKRDIVVEGESKNTRQNAVNCKRILDSLKITEPILLITSSLHMPRSIACFKKVGIDVIPVCVDGKVGTHKWLLDYVFLPDAYTILSWNQVFHEAIGALVYKIMGYT